MDGRARARVEKSHIPIRSCVTYVCMNMPDYKCSLERYIRRDGTKQKKAKEPQQKRAKNCRDWSEAIAETKKY